MERTQSVAPPDTKNLSVGICLIAAGALVASFATLSLAAPLKLALLAVGILLCIIGIVKLRSYCVQERAFRKYVPEWDKGRGMFDRFALELNRWHEGGSIPESCDGDTAYFLKLQRARLDRKGLKMRHRVTPVKGESFGTASVRRKSPWYTVNMDYENISRQIAFENAQGVIYDRTVEEVMYEMIVHSPNESELAHMDMTCPNCGAVSPVALLTEGCRYCGTRFRITDLFPRVTNLFFLRSNSIHKNKTVMRNTFLTIMSALFLITFLITFFSGEHSLPYVLLNSYLVALIAGGFGGLIVTDLILLLSLFQTDGRKHIPLKALSSKRKLTRAFSRYDRNFSYEKFEGQIISLVRMAVFSDDRANLASFCGEPLHPYFDNIVEMTYINALLIKELHVQNNILHVTLRTWWINYSEHNGQIYKSGDCIDVSLRRSIAEREAPGFSITSVSCTGCGGSFDAVRQRVCPYCHTEYHMENKGWVIEGMMPV